MMRQWCPPAPVLLKIITAQQRSSLIRILEKLKMLDVWSLLAHHILERIWATTNLLGKLHKGIFLMKFIGWKNVYKFNLKSDHFESWFILAPSTVLISETTRVRAICQTNTSRKFHKEFKETKSYKNFKYWVSSSTPVTAMKNQLAYYMKKIW